MKTVYNLSSNRRVMCTVLLAFSVFAFFFWTNTASKVAVHIEDAITVRTRPLPVLPRTNATATTSTDKSWRRTNSLVAEYRQGVATRLISLTSRKALATDPEVIQLARDLLDLVPQTAALGIKRARELVKTPQAESVEKITNRKREGFFIECGALDGERSSNTIWLESGLGWTGLLIEMDPFFYTQLLGKNRRVSSANACLSPYTHVTMLPYRGSTSGQGQLLYEPGQKSRVNDAFVPCLPLESFLAAINQTHIDYFSLDVEGAELDVLKTIPFDRIDIDILSVEYLHAPHGKKTYSDFMDSKGYSVHADIHDHRPNETLYVDDFIFVKKR